MREAIGVAALVAAAAGFAAAPRPPDVPFHSKLIDGGASETSAVADVNRDGRPDIVSGEFWYEAPAWQAHRFREVNFQQQYIDDFSDLIVDVDNDGYPDVVSVSWFARKVAWWRNPGRGAGLWKEAGIHDGFNVEFAVLADMDNDGKANEIVAQENGTGQAWYEPANGAWVAHVVSDRSYGHGIGAGDVNGDRRTDILTPRGWLEAPADPRAGNWTFHADWETTNPPVSPPANPNASPAAPGTPARVLELGFMHVVDVNGDGRNDVIAGAAHDYGVYWYEQPAEGPWIRRAIDVAWSQAHASTLVDVNGDGRPDLVTGKRFMAHNGSDPGEREPVGVYWYEFRPEPAPANASAGRGGRGGPGSGGVEWVRHVIEYGGRVGGGMQIAARDIDGDGDLDLVAGGKGGLFLLENMTKRR